ncbi:MAG: hypothetical protein NZM12_12725, partial [Steroidobacteraceae bacterium]|nr:hypothetical protein [Steroidobacteraceae bacterium]MDW8260177.1 hypothetical protein [Gammaproteobacteria bacterium]
HRGIAAGWPPALADEPVVVRAAASGPATLLEDRIAWLDDSLTVAIESGGESALVGQLHAERARLLDTLVRVRYAEQVAALSD